MGRLIVVWGIPGSNRLQWTQRFDWDTHVGGLGAGNVKIANEDITPDFAAYQSIGYDTVVVWNQAWLEDPNLAEDFANSETVPYGYSYEGYSLNNDVYLDPNNKRGGCNLNTTFGANTPGYYAFIQNLIGTHSNLYQVFLKNLSLKRKKITIYPMQPRAGTECKQSASPIKTDVGEMYITAPVDACGSLFICEVIENDPGFEFPGFKDEEILRPPIAWGGLG